MARDGAQPIEALADVLVPAFHKALGEQQETAGADDLDVVGVQEIGAKDFAVTRTVSTGSWIDRWCQGAGHGKATREAVLHLAFDGLGAERADTAAWVTNHASLGVSRSLGYRDNGTTTRAAEGKRVDQVNLTLSRTDWHRPPENCVISGLTSGAADMLGLAPGVIE